MTETTKIRNAAWIIGWDTDRNEHVYLKNADFVFRDNTIVFVGHAYAGPYDHEIDGAGKMIMPGLISIHAHLGGGPLDKGTFDEVGATAMWGNALYSHSPLLQPQPADIPLGAVIALSEMLLSGVTTVVDNSAPYPEWIDLMAQSGIRGFLGPGFRQARWINVNDHRVDYEWDDEAGWVGFENALKLIDEAMSHECGRLSGIIFPSQVDTCNAELLQASFKEAEKRNLPYQTHASQTMVEFTEMMRRQGVTPVQWLDSIGVLAERTILGHCIYLDHHSWTPLRTRNDLPLLAQRGVTVAHCPTVFGRTGMALESFGEYIRQGVALGVGLDSFPYNMLEELRHAAIYSRIISGNVHDLTTAHVFNAATIGGARALLREDLGRLQAGAKADFVVVDTEHPLMRPGREPMRNLIYVAAERAVKDVYVDGIQRVAGGKVLSLDYEDAVARIDEAQQRAIAQVPELDRKNRTLDQLAPLAFAVRDSSILVSTD